MYELEKYGNSLFQQFAEEIEKNHNLFSDFARAVRVIEETAAGQRYPLTKFRKLKSNEKRCQIYEAKAGKVRIYLFHEKNTGRIVVTGGLKKRQKKDISKVISIIKDYYDERGK